MDKPSSVVYVHELRLKKEKKRKIEGMREGEKEEKNIHTM